MATTLEVFQTAFAHHQAGRLREAEALYRQVLAAHPDNAEACHLLGLVAYQAGKQDIAEQLVSRAISLQGNRALFHSNLGAILKAAGRSERAEQSLRQAIALDPQLPDAYNNLGNVLLARGQVDEASDAYHQAIRLKQDFAEPLNNLGTILHKRGELNEAIAYYRQALSNNPRYADAYDNLGTALKDQGKLDEAAEAYHQALRLNPQNGAVQANLGTVHQGRGEFEAAVACYREALRLNPMLAVAHNNLGTVLKEQGDLEGAIACYRRAIELDGESADPHFNLGIVWQLKRDLPAAAAAYRRAAECNSRHAKALTSLGRLLEQDDRLEEALEQFDRAIDADPQLTAAYLHRANIHKLRRRTAEAIADFQTVLRLEPRSPEAFNNLALLYTDIGQPDLAVECCRRGLEQAPDSAALHSNLAVALGYQGRQVEAVAAARKAVELRPEGHIEYCNLLYGLNFLPGYDPQKLFEEHLDWARRHAEPLTAVAPPHDNDPAPDRRLRVGYVSPYFRQHAVNFFTEPLIAAHDHDDFEIYCYSDVRFPDAATERLQAAADHWRAVRHLTDEQLAAQIRHDEIDILVDLTGHISHNRLLVFARRPAPVQVTYIGYQNTTGMSAMDYRLTDARADPPGQTDRDYTERLVRLPQAYFCYRPADEVPEVTPLPAGRNGFVTFGSFNNFTKVTPQVIDAWFEILARVPRSRLLVLANQGGYVAGQFDRRAHARAIEPARIELVNRMPRAEYYKLLQRADIALDPFPFNGHTTTCDSIWLGVPVVMLEGGVYAQRFGASVLANVGTDQLITRSVDEYVNTTVNLASDLEGLARLRAELRPRMAASPLLDFAGFANRVEAAYRQMWIDWCASGGRK